MIKLYRVREVDQRFLVKQPETAMGLHVIQATEDEVVLVLGGQVAVLFADIYSGHLNAIDDFGFDQLQQAEADVEEESREEKFHSWLKGLPELEVKLADTPPSPSTALSIQPLGKLPLAPQPPNTVYGHLPFHGLTAADDAFYRWEPWPISKRIDQRRRAVVPGTFTAPASEIPFMPTGFSVVARLALPGLIPACFRWELRPPKMTAMRCGASVQMYGQSGGGVEVVFHLGFTNVGPIADSIVIPAL